jgi:hypothetical protein
MGWCLPPPAIAINKSAKASAVGECLFLYLKNTDFDAPCKPRNCCFSCNQRMLFEHFADYLRSRRGLSLLPNAFPGTLADQYFEQVWMLLNGRRQR